MHLDPIINSFFLLLLVMEMGFEDKNMFGIRESDLIPANLVIVPYMTKPSGYLMGNRVIIK